MAIEESLIDYNLLAPPLPARVSHYGVRRWADEGR